MAPLLWQVVAGCHLSHGPMVRHGTDSPLPWSCGGCPLSCIVSQQAATSPVALWWDVAWTLLSNNPVMGCGRVPPLPCWVMLGCPLSCGPVVGRSIVPPPQRTGLCPIRLHAAAPCLSPLPARFCPAQNNPLTSPSSTSAHEAEALCGEREFCPLTKLHHQHTTAFLEPI